MSGAGRARDRADINRPQVGIGIDEGDVCATDGHAAIRFTRCGLDGCVPTQHNGCYWSRGYVEAEVKMAGRKGTVSLLWGSATAKGFPPLSRVEPEKGFAAEVAPVGLDPVLLAQLVAASEACKRERDEGEKASDVRAPGALLVALRGELDPTGWVVDGGSHPSAHAAYVTIMPMRV